MATINQHIKDFLRDEYLPWAYSHKKFLNNKQVNILAQFMPSKSYEMPDYKLSQFCIYFHHALVDAIESKPVDSLCFAHTYCKAQIKMHHAANHFNPSFHRNIKELAESLDITPQAVSLKAHNFIQRVWMTAQNNFDANVKAYDLTNKIASVEYSGFTMR
jgi:hypothetical protein